MVYTLTIEFETQLDKEIFKKDVEGTNGVAFNTNKVFEDYKDMAFALEGLKSVILNETELSLQYSFEKVFSLEYEFYENICSKYINNRYTLIMQKKRFEFYAMLKTHIQFGNWLELKNLNADMILVKDYSPQLYRRKIKRIEKKLIKTNYEDISLALEFCDYCERYNKYDIGIEDKHKPNFFFKLYQRITNPLCQEMFHEQFFHILRKGKIKLFL